MKVIKIAVSDFSCESRDTREVNTLVEMGQEVLVLSKQTEAHPESVKRDGYTIIRKKLGDKTRSGRKKITSYIASSINWVLWLRKEKPDILSCHDWFPLLLGYLASRTLFGKKRPSLIYDSHELEMARAKASKRRSITTRFIMALEKFLIKRSEAVIVVNESIAGVIAETYNLERNPIVVRNIPEYWQYSAEVAEKQREYYKNKFKHAPENKIIMYHGIISRGRGLENIFKALASIDKNVIMIVLGYGESLPYYKRMVEELNLSKRVFFHDAVDFDHLYQYICIADIGLCLIENYCLSYYLSLPNKLFECIQAGVPVIGSNFPEISRIIDEYKIGITCNPDDMDEIAENLEKLLTDNESYKVYKKNVFKAKELLNWDKERKVLIDLYTFIINKRLGIKE